MTAAPSRGARKPMEARMAYLGDPEYDLRMFERAGGFEALAQAREAEHRRYLAEKARMEAIPEWRWCQSCGWYHPCDDACLPADLGVSAKADALLATPAIPVPAESLEKPAMVPIDNSQVLWLTDDGISASRPTTGEQRVAVVDIPTSLDVGGHSFASAGSGEAEPCARCRVTYAKWNAAGRPACHPVARRTDAKAPASGASTRAQAPGRTGQAGIARGAVAPSKTPARMAMPLPQSALTPPDRGPLLGAARWVARR